MSREYYEEDWDALYTTHEQTDILLQIRGRKDDGRILATEFEGHGGQVLGGILGNDAADTLGANEGDVADER